jgi:hypothetical protein
MLILRTANIQGLTIAFKSAGLHEVASNNTRLESPLWQLDAVIKWIDDGIEELEVVLILVRLHGSLHRVCPSLATLLIHPLPLPHLLLHTLNLLLTLLHRLSFL